MIKDVGLTEASSLEHFPGVFKLFHSTGPRSSVVFQLFGLCCFIVICVCVCPCRSTLVSKEPESMLAHMFREKGEVNSQLTLN